VNETPSANRVHIGFFGRRNTGKSSLANAVTGQDLSLVSDVKGTTTDPVYKAMELLPLGPVVIIDTPGFDDEGELGALRVGRARQALNKTDVAVLVTEARPAAEEGPAAGAIASIEEELIEIFKAKNIPYIIVQNKSDLFYDDAAQLASAQQAALGENGSGPMPVSAKTGLNINALKEKIASLALAEGPSKPLACKPLVADLVKPMDIVFLVAPIDKAAPKGRLILPQQQAIRGILDAGAIAIAVKDSELEKALSKVGPKPDLVITDSQVFAQAAKAVPEEIRLTSFSILFARHKGFLETAVRGASALDSLEDGSAILICEGCTHHRQCDDIGTVKIPNMVKKHSGKSVGFSFRSGGDFPLDLSPYGLVIHCGACMLNGREMHYRQSCANDQKIPFTNYGIAIAHIQGILKRSISFL
jgi:[FeFe] hydrogenase H-cluster maturation GTPase HydF